MGRLKVNPLWLCGPTWCGCAGHDHDHTEICVMVAESIEAELTDIAVREY